MFAAMYPELARVEDAYHRERLQTIFRHEGRQPRRRQPRRSSAGA